MTKGIKINGISITGVTTIVPGDVISISDTSVVYFIDELDDKWLQRSEERKRKLQAKIKSTTRQPDIHVKQIEFDAELNTFVIDKCDQIKRKKEMIENIDSQSNYNMMNTGLLKVFSENNDEIKEKRKSDQFSTLMKPTSIILHKQKDEKDIKEIKEQKEPEKINKIDEISSFESNYDYSSSESSLLKIRIQSDSESSEEQIEEIKPIQTRKRTTKKQTKPKQTTTKRQTKRKQLSEEEKEEEYINEKN